MPRAQREQLILDVAGQVFARSDYHSASMDEIAQLADVSKPMLYAYFGSKVGLYVACIDRTGRGLIDRLLAAGDPGAAPVIRLRAQIGDFLSFVEEYGDGWTVLFRAMTASRPIAEQVAELRGQIADAIRELVEGDGSSWSGLRPPASDGVAHAIVGAGESLANWWLEHPDVRREEVTDWYVGLVQATVAAALRSD